MELKLNYYGNALLVACALMIITMVLHPSGGSIANIKHISSVNIISHSIAIAAMPVCLFGFWGLSSLLNREALLSRLGLAVMVPALFAAVLAAAVNGLALIFFVNDFKDAGADILPMVKIVMRYNTALNHAFDYIFISGTCAAMLLWSAAIIKTSVAGKWLGWLGLVVSVVSLMFMFSGSDMVCLQGFRLFVLGFAVWTIAAALEMNRVARRRVEMSF